VRLPLATTLADLLGALAATPDPGAVRVTRVSFDLPLEVRLAGAGDDAVLLANVPRWRWTTDFDSRPGRLYAAFVVERAS
jgi:hypothetical protein